MLGDNIINVGTRKEKPVIIHHKKHTRLSDCTAYALTTAHISVNRRDHSPSEPINMHSILMSGVDTDHSDSDTT